MKVKKILRELKPGQDFVWCGTLFVLLDEPPTTDADGNAALAVKYLRGDYKRRWEKGARGLANPDDEVEVYV